MGFCTSQLGLPVCVIGLKIQAGIPWTLLWSILFLLDKCWEHESKILEAHFKTFLVCSQNVPGTIWERLRSDLRISIFQDTWGKLWHVRTFYLDYIDGGWICALEPIAKASLLTFWYNIRFCWNSVIFHNWDNLKILKLKNSIFFLRWYPGQKCARPP